MQNKVDGHQLARNLYGPPQSKPEWVEHSERIVEQEKQLFLEDVTERTKGKESNHGLGKRITR